MIRLLTTGCYLPRHLRQCCWVEVGHRLMLAGLCIGFEEDSIDSERVLSMHISPVIADAVEGRYTLPVSQPIEYQHMAQVSLMPRAVDIQHGRTQAVFIEYINHSRRTAKC